MPVNQLKFHLIFFLNVSFYYRKQIGLNRFLKVKTAYHFVLFLRLCIAINRLSIIVQLRFFFQFALSSFPQKKGCFKPIETAF
jgi:hypothetical protein